MQAVIYTRVSLNRNGGRSVQDQERECRAECDRRGWDVRNVYCDDGISASRYGRHRPQWQECKDALRPDDVLVVWEASRAQRDLQEFVALRDMCADLGVLLSYSGRVLDLSKGDDRFTGGLDALLAERESEQFKERVLRGKRAGAREGRPAGRVPWGYRSVSPGVWEPHPIEAPKIKQAVERILNGESHYSVWQWLGEQDGYKPSTITVMNRSLRTPTIAGLRIHRGEVVGKGNWPPLITEAEHRRLTAQHQYLKTSYAFTHNPGPEPKHLLSGIASCGVPECGAALSWRRSVHGTPTYSCRKGHVSRTAANLEKLVEKKLFERLADVDPAQFESADDPTISAAWAQIEELKGKQAHWQGLAMKGSISPESFAIFEQSLLKEISDLESKMVVPQYIQRDLPTIAANWSDMALAEKRRIIRAFFTITVHPACQGQKVGTGGIDIAPL